MQFRKHSTFQRFFLLFVAVIMAVGFVRPIPAHANTICVNTDASNGCVDTLQAAVNAAVDGDTITVAAGTYTLASEVVVNKTLTISGAGAGKTIFKVSGAGPHLTFSAAGSTLENVEIEKTDIVAEDHIITVAANNITIRGNTIHGQFILNQTNEVDRAFVPNAGVTGLLVEGNTIYNLRQPAYLNGAGAGKVTGTIKDNVVYGTKGWVVASGLYDFINNSWGDGSHPNYMDIAILGPADAANNYPAYYGDLITLSKANHNAIIENQTVSPAELTEVFVDPAGSSKLDGTITQPYATITPALVRVMAGGTIHVAAGNYLEALSMTKAGVQLLGAGKGVTTLTGPKTGSSATLELKANNILVDGIKITREGNNPTDWNSNTKTSGVSFFDVSGVTLQNCEVSGNRNGVYFNGFSTANNAVQNCVITNNRTGVSIFRGAAGNKFLNNEISHNWTFGVIFVPFTAADPAVVSGFTFTDNRIFGNWYAQVMDRNNLDSLTPMIDMHNNWFGFLYPSYSTTNIVEPGYTDQVPEQFGGTAKAPTFSGGIVDTNPDYSTIDYAPWYTDEQLKNTASVVIFMPVLGKQPGVK